ncbi:MAG: methionine--tRNA ligase [candidate division WOR-3 bacterium]
MRILVTTALPYANGDIHLGHLAGCYLPADIYCRYQRSKGRDVIHIGGTDEHGVPITLLAEREKKSPQEIVDFYHKRIKDSFEKFGILFDNFSRTSLPLHHKTSQDFFLKIYEKGYIYPKKVRQFFCPNCGLFLADRYLEGTCPHCQNPKARGDQCEECGRWLEPFMLLEPKCKTCGGLPEERETEHYFFALSRFQKQLADWIKEKGNWKENVKRFCEGWFRQGLEDRAITRDLPWGVKVPLPEAKGKVLYVWFDAPIGYISSTMEWAEKIGKKDLWKEYWLSSETRLIHFIGKDNIVFHAIVWPAMLMAYGDFILPSEIPANEFLNLEGRKISTSENWAIWLPDYLKEFPPDPLRYALANNLPENRDIDFTYKEFQAKNNNELADIYGNFVNRVLLFIKKNLGEIKEGKVEDEVRAKIEEVKKEAEDLIERFRIRDGLKVLMALPSFGNRYFDYQEPWRTVKSDRKRCEKTIFNCLKLIEACEVLLRPYLPFTSEKMRRMLSLKERNWDELEDNSFFTTSPQLGEIEILFNKIPDEKIEIELKKLKGETMEITIEDFKKIDLRVGRIINAERVPGSDKLLKLEVNLGSELRQIVAGIGSVYEPEELIGKNVCVVANLKKAKLRGVESYGMILAAEDGAVISLLVTDKEIRPGSPIL